MTNPNKSSSTAMQVASDIAVIKNKIIDIETNLSRLNVSHHGNGGPGINTRLDRLEQTEARRGKLIFAAVAASIVAAVGTIFSWFGQ
jgi:hypothetical protein